MDSGSSPLEQIVLPVTINCVIDDFKILAVAHNLFRVCWLVDWPTVVQSVGCMAGQLINRLVILFPGIFKVGHYDYVNQRRW